MFKVFQKELKELLRDKKTIIFMIALPMLLFPVIFGVAGFVSVKAVKKEEAKVLRYTVFANQQAEHFVDTLAQQKDFSFIEVADIEEAKIRINQGSLDFALVISEQHQQMITAKQQVKWQIYFNDAAAVNLLYKRVNDLVQDYREQLQQSYFSEFGVAEEQQQGLINPISLEKVDVADKRENLGEKLGGLIPYIVMLLCLQGAMVPAIDLGAGEKERGTLETLLITPLPREHIIIGKFLTICSAGMITALLTVSSMGIWGLIFGQGMAVKFLLEFFGAISILDFVLMFAVLIPVVAILASALLSMSIYGRSFKEAQSYMGSLVMVLIVPIFMSMLPGIKLEDGWAWVPITNVSLAMKELVKGTMDYWMLLGIFTSSLVLAGAMLAFCVYWFKQEKVLFR